MAKDRGQRQLFAVLRRAEDLVGLVGSEGLIDLLGELLADAVGPATNLIVDQLDVLFPVVDFVKFSLEDGNLMGELQEVSLVMIISSGDLLLELFSEESTPASSSASFSSWRAFHAVILSSSAISSS